MRKCGPGARSYSKLFAPYICDVGQYLAEADEAGKKIMFEAQLGALRDIDFGIYPYTSFLQHRVCLRPHRRRHPGPQAEPLHRHHEGLLLLRGGEGPFTAELAMTEEEKHALREGTADEYGAATGRPRRVGPFDAVASRYGVQCQGCDELALTLLDVLDYMEEVPIVTAYRLTDGSTTTPWARPWTMPSLLWRRFPAGTATSPASASLRTCR